ncbi:MAG: hydantoinase/oxoprolinase family protein [Bacillota bacterium]
MARYKLAVDTGGTFTDFCLFGDNGELHVFKEPSTPDDPSRAVLEGIKRISRQKGIPPGEIDLFLHGTTVATNAILERKGARLALVTTKGFKDIIFIGRQNRPHLYNFRHLKPQPLVARNLVFEVNERILADGLVVVELGEQEIASVVAAIVGAGVESVAICLLHAYVNPVHEMLLKRALQEKLPHLSVTISSEILPEFREYERTSTTVLNAFVRPVVNGYLGRLEKGLKSAGVKSGLYIMQSNGGVVDSTLAREQSVRTVLSGPAGGVMAGVCLARLTRYKNLITVDMGGTSMDICLIRKGAPRFTSEGSIEGYPLRLPMLDVHTIGAGGGSIAWVDSGGALQVGPRSAGAFPGPACYNHGGQEPTVTDANLVLGRLSPEDFAGGLSLRPDLSERSISQRVGKPLRLTPREAAEGIIRVLNANMVRALRVVSVQKGHDPRDFCLMAFGGAGPLHAVELARELGIPRVVVPPYPGVTSAWGMLSVDVRHDYTVTFRADLVPEIASEINRGFAQLESRGMGDLFSKGFTEEEILLSRFADIRYKGQSYELSLPFPNTLLGEREVEAIARCFHRLHRQCYGYCRENAPLEVVALRLTAAGKLPKTKPRRVARKKEPVAAGVRTVYLAGELLKVPVFQRREIAAAECKGPAIISQADSTTLLWPGDIAWCDRWGNIVINTAV